MGDEFNPLESLAWDMQPHMPLLQIQSDRWDFVDKLGNNVKNTHKLSEMF
jgi:hypothetical protein